MERECVKVNNKLLVSGVLISTLFGGAINNVHADTIKNDSNFLNTKLGQVGQEGALQDIDNILNQLVDSINKNSPLMTHIALADNGIVNYSGININQSNVTNVIPLFLGNNTFSNTSSEEQSYNTSIFSQAITYTKSTSIQNGFKTGLKVGGKAGIPFVAEGAVETSLEYNFSSTGTSTSSETNTITAPSQPVKVPAGKTYKVEVYFEKKSTSGTVDLFADVNQGVRGNRLHPDFAKLSHFLYRAEDKHGVIQTPNDPDSIRIKGSGNFRIEYGTNLIVKTYDISSKPNLKFRSLINSELESDILVNEQIIPLKSPNKK
ncbi:hypothetical protein GH861_27170 [Bacillus thuringiensis]|nr:hypothetical protein [Bacillus thuringiensis]